MKISEIKGRIKLPAMASIYYLTASVAGKAVSFVITPFITRLLDKESYGQFSLYMTVVGGASLITATVTSSSAFYKGMKDHETNKTDYLRSVLTVSVCFSMLICLLLFTFSRLLHIDKQLLLPMAAQIFCDGIIAVGMSADRYDYKYKSVFWIALISAVLPPLSTVLILKTWGGGYTVRIYALLFISLCLAAYSTLRILRGERKKDGRSVKYVIKESAPLIPNGISAALLTQADKLFITAIMGTAALAKYTVVYSLGIALQFTVTAIASALTPWIMRRLVAGEVDRISQLIAPMTVGYYALSLCLVAIAPEAMRILAPSDYAEALPAILPLALSTPFLFISTVATAGITHSGKGRYLLISSAAGAFFGVTFNYMLIDRFGFSGAGIGVFLCQGVRTAIELTLLKRVNLENVIPLRQMLVPCLIGIGGGAIMYILRQSVIPRIVALSLPALMLIYCLRRAEDLILEKGTKKVS